MGFARAILIVQLGLLLGAAPIAPVRGAETPAPILARAKAANAQDRNFDPAPTPTSPLAKVTSVPAAGTPRLPAKGAPNDAGPAHSPAAPLADACFARVEPAGTVFTSADAGALRSAIAAVTPGGTVKLAGACAGVSGAEVALITRTITLIGGYTPTNWLLSYPITQPTILDAQGGGRVLRFDGAADDVSNLTIQNGLADQGGGIRASGALTLTRVNVYTNTASAYGGGVIAYGPMRVKDALFRGNESSTAPGGDGGALDAESSLVVENSVFQNNRCSNGCAYGGGAIWAASATSISRSRFEGNAADGNGGAIAFAFGVAGSGNLEIVNTLLAGNTPPAVVANPGAGRVDLIFSTIASPTVATGEAIRILSGAAAITNTLIASHTIGINLVGGAATERFTLFSGVSAPYSGSVTSGGGSITGTAGFANPVAGDYRVTAGSAAINAGVFSGVSVDFEGGGRPSDGGYEIGYDETPGNVCYARTEPSQTVYTSTTASALRSALAETGRATVKVAGYCAGAVSVNSGVQVASLRDTITVVGGYAPANWSASYPLTQPTTLDAQAQGRVLAIEIGATARVENVNVVNGTASEGGGIKSSGALILVNSIVSGNTAGFGGGILSDGALAVISSTIAGNRATNAGFGGGGLLFFGSATIIASAIRNNAAPNYGGGIQARGPLTITRSTLAGNTSGGVGGAIFAQEDGVIYLAGSAMFGNSAATGGGGISTNRPATLINSTLASNSAGTTGGGINSSDLLTVTASTFWGNGAGAGGDIQTYDANSVRTQGSIFAGGVSGGACNGLSAASDGGYNLSDDASCAFGPTSVNSATLMASLGPLRDNGGPTWSIALLPGSPALDVIPAGAIGCGTTLAEDQRGLPRLDDCDAGAYEAQPRVTECSFPSAGIPDNGPLGISDTLTFAAAGTIADLYVKVNATHTYVGDLVITVTRQNTSAVILNRPGVPTAGNCSGDNIDQWFNDGGSVSAALACRAGAPAYPTDATLVPNNPLSVFDGQKLAGPWRLTVSDNAASDVGTLVGWCVSAELNPFLRAFVPIVRK